jgi:plasmid stability protein
MLELVINDLEQGIFEKLRERAEHNDRSPPEEAKAILREALAPKTHAAWTDVDAIFSELSRRGTRQTDSVDLLREDRER